MSTLLSIIDKYASLFQRIKRHMLSSQTKFDQKKSSQRFSATIILIKKRSVKSTIILLAVLFVSSWIAREMNVTLIMRFFDSFFINQFLLIIIHVIESNVDIIQKAIDVISRHFNVNKLINKSKHDFHHSLFNLENLALVSFSIFLFLSNLVVAIKLFFVCFLSSCLSRSRFLCCFRCSRLFCRCSRLLCRLCQVRWFSIFRFRRHSYCSAIFS